MISYVPPKLSIPRCLPPRVKRAKLIRPFPHMEGRNSCVIEFGHWIRVQEIRNDETICYYGVATKQSTAS